MGKRGAALISVSDTRGLAKFVTSLSGLGFAIYATGNTKRTLQASGLNAHDVSEITGFTEMLEGRIKTIHPHIYAGILSSRSKSSHMDQLSKLRCPLIDVVVVNPYALPRDDMDDTEIQESIDIGGIGLLRAAAKNYPDVVVVCDPSDYDEVVTEFASKGDISLETRKRLAVKAFRRVATYEQRIAQVLAKALRGEEDIYLHYQEGKNLRYGENWHQQAKWYVNSEDAGCSVASARMTLGEQMSFNNLFDSDAAFWAAFDMTNYGYASVIIKHAGLCSAATGASATVCMKAAWDGDPMSSYGCVLALTFEVDTKEAEALVGKFVEVLVAPSFTDAAIELLSKRNQTIRLVEVKDMRACKPTGEFRFISGGLLAQERDIGYAERSSFRSVTKVPFPEDKFDLARFACLAVKHVKSNAVLIAREYSNDFYQTIGIGGGQPNRVDALTKLAIPRAREFCSRNNLPSSMLSDCVLSSDSFFPFADSIEAASKAGIVYVVQPGGSKRDAEVIAAADRLGMSMVFTGRRGFKH